MKCWGVLIKYNGSNEKIKLVITENKVAEKRRKICQRLKLGKFHLSQINKVKYHQVSIDAL